jgi:RsiW-degrading membrane proteinase PrsW (M82 family)
MALQNRDWRQVAVALTDVQKETFKPLPLTLAAVAGLVWFAIALQAIQPTQWIGARTILPVLAVLAGLASTWASHFIAIWQEEMWGLHATGNFLNDFLYHLGGTAPREEFIKLLLLVPFLPILLKRGSRLEMLVISGCIGLGFAIEGNLQSYEHGGPDGAFGRFLTANFFHLAASGLVGLAFCEFILAPKRCAMPFLLTLVGVIMAHGIYDAFMAVQGVRLLSIFSMLSFLALSLIFFHQLRQLRDHTTDQLYISATLLMGMSILTGTMLVCAAMQLGFPLAVTSLAANAAGLSLVICLFYRQLGRGLAPVPVQSPIQ